MKIHAFSGTPTDLRSGVVPLMRHSLKGFSTVMLMSFALWMVSDVTTSSTPTSYHSGWMCKGFKSVRFVSSVAHVTCLNN